MSRAPEFITLSDAASRAVAGANSRHAALIEDAFDVLVETPGGGVSLTGDSKGRAQAKKAVQAIAERADQGLDIAESDVRVAIGNARSGGAGPGALPVGRRGQVAPKTRPRPTTRRRWPTASWFGLGPAGTGKTFLAGPRRGLLPRGEVDAFIARPPSRRAAAGVSLPATSPRRSTATAPVWEALTDILGAEQLRRRREKGEIEVAPIAFLRGRTLRTPSSSSTRPRTRRGPR